MTFKEHMQQTVKEAEQTNKICYLILRYDFFSISNQYQDDWLFKAYPGGRKVLSVKGTKMLEREEATG
jgi:hypothetical protein